MYNQNTYLKSDCSKLPQSAKAVERNDAHEMSFVFLDIVDKYKAETNSKETYEQILDRLADTINEHGELYYSTSSPIDFEPPCNVTAEMLRGCVSKDVLWLHGDLCDQYRDDPSLRISGDELMEMMLGTYHISEDDQNFVNEDDAAFVSAVLYAIIAVLYCDDTALCWDRCAA